MESMFGLVLCGGKSTRMGTDKGTISLNGISWAQHQFQLLNTILPTNYVSVNKEQMESYQNYFPSQTLIKDSKTSVQGPLQGLISAHQKFPNHDFFVLACDLPTLKSDLLHKLFIAFKQNRDKNFDAFVFETAQGIEPLVAIYTARLLSKINNLIIEGNLQKFSMKYILDLGKTYVLKTNEVERLQFNNLNTVEDLHILKLNTSFNL